MASSLQAYRRPGNMREIENPIEGQGIVEKIGFVVTVAVLLGQARISAADATTAGPDLVLCVLFIIAFVKTATSDVTP